MAFNRLYKHIENLIQNDDDVADSTPCKADILSVRECRKDGGKVRRKNDIYLAREIFPFQPNGD